MTLEKSIDWLEGEIKTLKAEQKPNEKQLKVYQDFHEWLYELFRFRLFFSEFAGEIECSENVQFPRDWLLKFIESELKDWNLDGYRERIIKDME